MAVSDRWLRTFVMVAEAGTFSAAAKRLDVSQPAVSHAVARLEKELSCRLVDRGGRRPSLTPEGQRLYEQLGGSYDQIDAAVDALRSSPSSRPVSLSVSTSLANFWLLPRLPEFKRQYPDLGLRVITTDSDANVGSDDADLWIPLGSVDRAGLEAVEFRSERLVPVAGPSLAAELNITGPEALLEVPLLHLEERYAPRYTWPTWFEDHGIDVSSPLPGYRTNDYSLLLQAALEEQGVALGWDHIVARLLDSGRLVALAEPIETNNPFMILSRDKAPLRPEAALLREWLVLSD